MDILWLERKVIFMLLVLLAYVFLDRVLFRGFNTAEVVRHDPKAVSILFAGFLVAWALV